MQNRSPSDDIFRFGSISDTIPSGFPLCRLFHIEWHAGFEGLSIAMHCSSRSNFHGLSKLVLVILGRGEILVLFIHFGVSCKLYVTLISSLLPKWTFLSSRSIQHVMDTCPRVMVRGLFHGTKRCKRCVIGKCQTLRDPHAPCNA